MSRIEVQHCNLQVHIWADMFCTVLYSPFLHHWQDRAKKSPCVEIANLWECLTETRLQTYSIQMYSVLCCDPSDLCARYTASTPMSWFIEIQDVIRKHVSEHIKEPFVKAHSKRIRSKWFVYAASAAPTPPRNDKFGRR